MYDLSLSESFFPAIPDPAIEAITIGDLLRRQAASHGDLPALREVLSDGGMGRNWTYRDLLADAEKLGRALASRHAPGARIAVYANNLREWVLLELGAGLAGLALVTVNPAYQKRELEYVLAQSGSEAIYYVAEFRGNPMGAIAGEACAALPAIRHRILLTDHAALFDGHGEGVLPGVSPGDVTQIQ